jgi:hypothetical protein
MKMRRRGITGNRRMSGGEAESSELGGGEREEEESMEMGGCERDEEELMEMGE